MMAQVEYLSASAPAGVTGSTGVIGVAVDLDGRSARTVMLLSIGEIVIPGGGSFRTFAQETDDGVAWENVGFHPIVDENTPPGRVTQISFVRTKRYVRSRSIQIESGPLLVGLADYFGSIE